MYVKWDRQIVVLSIFIQVRWDEYGIWIKIKLIYNFFVNLNLEIKRIGPGMQ